MDFLMNSKFKQVIAGLLFSGMAMGVFAADDHPAQAIVVDSTSQLIDVLKTQSDRIKSDKAFLDEQIDKFVVPYVDFNTMTKLAVGKSWKLADEQQRVDLVSELNQSGNQLSHCVLKRNRERWY